MLENNLPHLLVRAF